MTHSTHLAELDPNMLFFLHTNSNKLFLAGRQKMGFGLCNKLRFNFFHCCATQLLLLIFVLSSSSSREESNGILALW
jgi:hypothetical protein